MNAIDFWPADVAEIFPELIVLPPLTADEIERLHAEYVQAQTDPELDYDEPAEDLG